MPRTHWPTFEERREKDDKARIAEAIEWYQWRRRELLKAKGGVTKLQIEGLRSLAAARFNVPKEHFEP